MHPFVHLHVHSQYSILDGQAAVTKLVDKARADGMPGIALTDHGNMFGIKVFTDYVNSINSGTDKAIKQLRGQLDGAEGDERARLEAEIAAEQAKIFTPIIGCEMYVADGLLTEHEDKRDTGRHLVVLAKNLTGYHNLIKLVSKSWTDGYYYHPRTDKTELAKHREGLIVLSACLGGEIPRLIMQGRMDEARASVQWFKDTFGDDYYLELQRHKPNANVVNTDTYPNQVAVNNVLIEWSKEMGVKLVCTNDVHFVDEGDAEAHDRLICISTGTFLDEQNRMHYTKQEWMKTQSEMNEVFADVPEALENTLEVVSKVERYSIEHGPILPDFPLPEGFSDNDQYLRHLVYEGAKRRWGDELTDEQRERLDFELDTIKNMGFPGYFLIVQDFIGAARRLGVAVGPGRGSAAGSAVAYCLGITDIDPIKYDLLFERFLNPDRISLPDIDVDFDDDGRAVVLRYVTQKYGAEKVAHIITIGTMASKSAIKDVARVLRLPLPESDKLAKYVPARDFEIEGTKYKVNLKNCYAHIPELHEQVEHGSELVRETLKYAQELEGNARNTGVHACGVIIGRDDITDWVPVATATDKDGEKVLVTQYEGSVIESTGLIKMDFLGLKTLSIIMEALENIKERHGIELDIDKIPIDDPKTYQLYSEGRTTGTFQFESTGMQKYLRELQPSTFEDLIAMNALYRPGPMAYIPQFIKRKHGQEPIEYDIPVMEKYLKDTYGITVYQEQVMLLSRQLANFTRGESDALRKAMGKKKKKIVDEMKPKFIEGGKANGHDPKILDKIWSDWEKFASYAFNKSHATCYSWVAYQTGYLKANYPAEYMAAVLSRNLNDITKLTKFMDECKVMKIDVKSPDINESRARFSVNNAGQIRFGLAAIKGVGLNAVQAILDERKANGPFKSVYDLVERINLTTCNRKVIDSLALAGAFDRFGVNREDFEKTDDEPSFGELLVRYGQRFQTQKANQTASLFGDIEEIDTAKPEPSHRNTWTDIQRLDREREFVGLYLSAHPLDKYYTEVEYGCNVKAQDYSTIKQLENFDYVLGGLVVENKELVSRNNSKFAVVKIEDYTGTAELRLYGRNYETFAPQFVVGMPVAVRFTFQRSRFARGDSADKLYFTLLSVSNIDGMRGDLVRGITLRTGETSLLNNRFSDLLAANVKNDDESALPMKLELINKKNNLIVELNSPCRVVASREFLCELEDMGIDFSFDSPLSAIPE
ncbi:MAG: DNA polymerase III subunit alpha [Bacteroidales bacterium]|nr:DNA polymerase III subunit alpha [Bacteroidales bacterium]